MFRVCYAYSNGVCGSKMADSVFVSLCSFVLGDVCLYSMFVQFGVRGCVFVVVHFVGGWVGFLNKSCMSVHISVQLFL